LDDHDAGERAICAVAIVDTGGLSACAEATAPARRLRHEAVITILSMDGSSSEPKNRNERR
jgi:hypothetical protein